MSRSKPSLRIWSAVLIIAQLLLFAPVTPAKAAWVETGEALGGSKARLITLLEREDVKTAIVNLGVDPAEAARRVDAMTEAEAADAMARLDSMPAGGDGIGVIVGAAVFVFVVLLITDILGFTNVFSFVKK